jgi:hypothetical protein
LRLQRIHPALDERIPQPHQSVEEIVRVFSRRHATRARNERLVCLVVRQCALRHEPNIYICGFEERCVERVNARSEPLAGLRQTFEIDSVRPEPRRFELA